MLLSKNTPAWISALIAFFVLLSASFSSYFGAIANIKEQIHLGLKEERNYVDNKYATKEEYQFIKETLLELKQDIKSIKNQTFK